MYVCAEKYKQFFGLLNKEKEVVNYKVTEFSLLPVLNENQIAYYFYFTS